MPIAHPRTSATMYKRFVDSEVNSELEEPGGRDSEG